MTCACSISSAASRRCRRRKPTHRERVHLCEMEVVLKSGARKTTRVEYHRGHFKNPMTDVEMEEKFRLMAQKHLGADRIENLLGYSPRHREGAEREPADCGYAGLITLWRQLARSSRNRARPLWYLAATRDFSRPCITIFPERSRRHQSHRSRRWTISTSNRGLSSWLRMDILQGSPSFDRAEYGNPSRADMILSVCECRPGPKRFEAFLLICA